MLLNNKICDLREILSKISSLSIDGQDLIKKILEKDPIERLSAKEALEHPWFAPDRKALLAGLYMNHFLCDKRNLKKMSHISSKLLVYSMMSGFIEK